MLHAFRLTVWFGFIAPIAALVLFAYVWDHPWLLWAVPLGLVLAALLFAIAGMAAMSIRDQEELKRQGFENGRGVDLFVRSRLLQLSTKEAPPPAGLPPQPQRPMRQKRS